MSKHSENTGLSRWIKLTLWVVGVLIALVVILRLSLKTSYVQNFAKEYALSIANEQLNAEITIDELSGDLWKEVRITDLRVTQQDTIIQIDSVLADYKILTLLGEQFEIGRLAVIAPQVNLRQEQGQWNIMNLVVTSPDTAEQDTSGTTFPFQIEDLRLDQGNVSIHSDSLPVESSFSVRDIALSSSLKSGEEVEADVRNFSFQIEQTQLENSVMVESSARTDSNSITLEKLVLATGNSMVRSSGFVNEEDSTVQFTLSASPFSWQDVAQYAEEVPLRQDLQVDLEVGGSLEDIRLALDIRADGLEAMQLEGRFQWDSGLMLQEFSATAKGIHPDILLSDTTFPAIQHVELSMNGGVYFDEYEKSLGTLTFAAENISTPQFHITSFTGSMDLNDNAARAELNVQQNQQELASEIKIDQLWSDLPAVTAQLEGSLINPGYWMQDSSYNGEVNFTSEVTGRGLFPDTTTWEYSLDVADSNIMDHSISSFSMQGEAGSQYGSANGTLNFGEGTIAFNGEAQQLDEIPLYSFNLKSHNVNVGPLLDDGEINTSINGSILGEGKGFDPASMNLSSTVSIDSTLINEELVDNISADIIIEDSIAAWDNTVIESSIAEGTFDGQFNMLRPYSPMNDLALDLKIKEINSLGPVFGTDTLEAEGTITGSLNPVAENQLQFTGDMNLSQIQYSSYRIEQLSGRTELILEEDIDYLVDLELSAPQFSNIQLQDLNIFTQGSYQESQTVEGELGVEFSSNEGEIEYSGSYNYSSDLISVNTTGLNIISEFRTLSLMQPFELTMRGDSIRMDTLRIASGDTAFVELALPIVSENEQRGYVQGKNLNTAVIQQALFEEPYFEGLFSGRIDFNRQDSVLNAQSELLLAELKFNETSFDSLRLTGDVKKERLQGRLSIHKADTMLIDGALNLPFRLEDPEDLPSIFFEQPVSGHLTIHDIYLEQFEQEFAEANIDETTGIFSFTGTLGGTAGQPEFSAGGSLRQARLSGVPVDSVSVGIKYSHSESLAALSASVTSMKQKAAEVELFFPLFINMKTFEVDLPQQEDSISATVQTDNFNLSSVDDFLDPQTVSDVNGRLNGTVEISGAIEDLQSEGQLTVEDASFSLIPAGVVVDNIRSTIDFAPNEIRLSRFRAESGGALNAKGIIQLEKLKPGQMDIQVKATNFQAANTDEYNAIINLDAQAQGTPTQPELTGSLNMISGFLELDNFGEKSVEEVELDTSQQEEESFSAYDSLGLEMEVSFDRRFYVRNERYLEMEIELGGQVDLVKERGGELQLFGSMNTEDGYALPLGKRFDLQEGVLTFSGDPGNPKLNIRTQYEPPQTEEEIIIWYVIQGTVEDPQFVYESQPQMELENILSYTLFGQPFYALDSWEQLVTNSGSDNGGTTATSVALGVLLDRVESVATQRLGIDVVRIENTRVGGENATSVTTGWYLNPRVFFAIQNIITGSTPNTGFLLEYMLRQNLELIIRQGGSIREGIDVRWEYDY